MIRRDATRYDETRHAVWVTSGSRDPAHRRDATLAPAPAWRVRVALVALHIAGRSVQLASRAAPLEVERAFADAEQLVALDAELDAIRREGT